MPKKPPSSPRDVMSEIKERDARFVDLKFVDLFGTLQHLTVSVESIDESTFYDGLGFDGSSVRGFKEINESDMLLLPDPTSLFVDPFFDDPTLSLFCDIIDPVGHKPYDRDVRGIARRAERLVESLGIADKVFMGPELEFFEDGNRKVLGTWENGVKTGVWTTWYDNGTKKSIEHYQGDVKHGAFRGWYDNGQQRFEGEIAFGLETGLWTHWHPNGQKKGTGEFSEGKPNGPWTTWHDNGQKHTEGNFSSGEKIGLWTSWSPEGEVESTERYGEG